ncbi:MAG TPA: SGNH hydrolase domain-containing protein [Solirubrobacteraceae bacterium]|nr:SGNH hydrolase domain-containing protein [Solirubrobacteraceae bacterium]
MRPTRLALLLALVLSLPAAGAAAQTAAPEEDAGRQEQAGQQTFPRCFGAASRDPLEPCRNPRLSRMVHPKPFDALLEPNSPCTFLEREDELSPCAFGVPQEEAAETIALIGDSHAAHWRAALDVVMAAKRWYGVSMTKAGCPLSTAVSDLPEPGKTKCIRWKRQLFGWFERHPEVTTVITSNHTGGKVVGAKGRDYSAHVVGYTKALAKLAPTVQRIISIRDVPRNTRNSMDCVARAIRRRKNAGPACAVPRSFALKRDPATAAARRSDPRRVQLVDMTRFMCSSRLCLPVIGGALVHKDQTHLTRVFATTLGPYLLRYVDEAFAHMAAGTRP